MKTNETDGATKRPWSINRKIKRYVDGGTYGDGLVTICDCDPIDEMTTNEANANAALIVQAVNEHEALLAVARAAKAMLENYRELKQITLAMARSDAPNWIGRNLTADDDIHVQAVTSALATLDKLTKVSVDMKQSTE